MEVTRVVSRWRRVEGRHLGCQRRVRWTDDAGDLMVVARPSVAVAAAKGW